LVGGREGTRERAHDDAGAPGGGGPAVRLLERARRRGGGLRQDGRVLDAGPELLGREVTAVDELLLTEADGERYHVDPELVGQRRRQVAGAVGDHSDV